MNVIKKYWDTVCMCQLLLAPIACMCAGVYYTMCRLHGIYEEVPWRYVLLFDCSHIVYLMTAVVIMYVRKKRQLEPDAYIPIVKGFVALLLLIQYTFILMLFPKNYTWGCTFLFLVAVMFSFDFKFMVANLLSYLAIAVLAHVIHTEALLSAREGGYLENVVWRLIIYAMFAWMSGAITLFVEKFIRRMQAEEDENTYLSQRQLSYYQNLDLMDKELRKFRHDIKNHFLCLEELIRREDLPQLKEYFTALQDDFSENHQLFFSGNVIVDSILNYDISHLCRETVTPVVYGKLPEIRTVTSMDLCTVFSNMLSNAIKGANQSEQDTELVVQFQGGEKFFSIRITNELSLKYRRADEEDRNHGHGIRNIMNVCDKYEGVFEQDEDKGNKIFVMQVYLPV